MNEIEIYKSLENNLEISVTLDKGTVWLTRHQLGLLFNRDIKTVGKHISNVFKGEELSKNAVVANFATTAEDGKTYQVSLEILNEKTLPR